MANIHRIGDLNRENNGNRPLLFQPNIQAPNPQLQAAIAQKKVPFIRPSDETRSPLDETIPYTWKIIWCPGIKIISLSVLLILACWVLYIVGLTQGIAEEPDKVVVLGVSLDVLVKMGAVEADLIHDGQVWRLLTASFLHLDLTHITLNTLSALFFLTRLEEIYNVGYVSVVLLVSAISGNILVALTLPDNAIAVGMSSMIYGMLGAYIAYMAINWESLGQLRTQLCCIIGLMSFFFFLSSFGEVVSFVGHAGGFLGGLFISLAILPPLVEKNKFVTIVGCFGIATYLLTTFIVFFIA